MLLRELEIEDRFKKILKEEGISSLYPPQKQAVKAGILDGKNIILSTPTASGKTLAAELAIIKKLHDKGKIVYIVPLKALAYEKYLEFRKYEKLGYKIILEVGDLDSSKYSRKPEFDIMVATAEKCDSILRSKTEWFTGVRLLVLDEIHLVASDRGPVYEIIAAKLMKLLPGIQLLGLSATIGNAGEISAWLNAILVESTWRPVKLREWAVVSKGIESIKKIVKDNAARQGQVLVFVNSRRSAESVAEQLSQMKLNPNEKEKLTQLSGEIHSALGNPTKQCQRLAECVKGGAAFHHAGLCLPYNSLIFLADGRIKKIGEIVEKSELVNVKSLNPDSLDITDIQVSKLWKLKSPEVLVEIETRTGRKITVTLNHPLLTVDGGGLKWKPAAELKKGMFIATPRELYVKGQTVNLKKLLPSGCYVHKKFDVVRYVINTLLEKYKDVEELAYHYDINVRTFRSYIKYRNIPLELLLRLARDANITEYEILSSINTFSCKGSQRPVIIPNTLNPDFLWFVGVIAADGTINGSVIRFFTSDIGLGRKFCRIVKELFNLKPNQFKMGDKLTQHYFSSKIISDLLTNHFGLFAGKKSNKIIIPLVSLSNEQIASYIDGLFSCDGNVNFRKNEDGAPSIEFTTASGRLAKELQMQLLRFRINAYLRIKPLRNSREYLHQGRSIERKQELFRLFIYGRENIKKFQQFIGFSASGKKKKLQDILDSNPSSNSHTDVIPTGFGTLIRKARLGRGYSLEDLGRKGISKATICRYENGKTPISRKTFRKIVKVLEGDSSPELRKIADSIIFWDRIDKVDIIKSKDEYVYDFSLETGNFVSDAIIAHNTNQQRILVEDAFKEGLIRVIVATPTLAAGINTPARTVVIRDLHRYTSEGPQNIPVLEYKQFAGRAGRPKYDKEGDSIAFAKGESDKSFVEEHYINGTVEDIHSMLGLQPVLRMHVLSSIASEFTKTRQALLEFFKSTFFGLQYGVESEFERQLEDIITELVGWKFIEERQKFLLATTLGKRISELYIDPLTARNYVELLAKAENQKKHKPLALLEVLCDAAEMRPHLRVKKEHESAVWGEAYDMEQDLLRELDGFDLDFEFLNRFKTARMFENWINETTEQQILDDYNIPPGILNQKLRNLEWLVYSATEITRILKLKETNKTLSKLELRVKHGIKEELIPLVGIKGVGRVRARKLFNAGVKTLSALKETRMEKLKILLGEKTVENVMAQL